MDRKIVSGPVHGRTSSRLPGPAGDEVEPGHRSMTPGSRSAYPGERLGLPERGAGSLAPLGRRLGALTIDWLISYGLAALALRLGAFPEPMLSTAVLVIWLVLGVVAVRLFTFTPGQLALGVQVAAVNGRLPVGVGRAVARGLLVGTVVPALFTDFDGRGLQDRLTGTAVVRC